MSEHGQQVLLFAWAKLHETQYPELALMFAVPNAGGYTGGYRANVIRALEMRKEGVRKGMPDILVLVPRGEYTGLFIEMKVDGNKARPEQEDWHMLLSAAGMFGQVCQGFEEARDMLLWYLGLPADPDQVAAVRNALDMVRERQAERASADYQKVAKRSKRQTLGTGDPT